MRAPPIVRAAFDVSHRLPFSVEYRVDPDIVPTLILQVMEAKDPLTPLTTTAFQGKEATILFRVGNSSHAGARSGDVGVHFTSVRGELWLDREDTVWPSSGRSASTSGADKTRRCSQDALAERTQVGFVAQVT